MLKIFEKLKADQSRFEKICAKNVEFGPFCYIFF